MKRVYDFANGRRGPVINPEKGKTRITIRIDDDVLSWFRSQVHDAGGGNYQTLMNEALREHIGLHSEDLDSKIRRLVREELSVVRDSETGDAANIARPQNVRRGRRATR